MTTIRPRAIFKKKLLKVIYTVTGLALIKFTEPCSYKIYKIGLVRFSCYVVPWSYKLHGCSNDKRKKQCKM